MKNLRHISSEIALTFIFFSSSGCQLQEIEPAGEACPPYLADGGYIMTGIVACYKDHFASECFDGDGNCIQTPNCASCRSDIADCIRYQKDFDLLVRNTQTSDKLYISAVNGNPDLSAYRSQFFGGNLNVCPVDANRCIWHKSGEIITDFGCIYCKDDICGAECVNLQSSHYNCGTCGNKCESTEHCNGGKCVPNVKCEIDEHTKFQGGTMICAADTVAECGNSLINCEDTPGWRDGSCDAGRCAASSCAAGYHRFGTSCEADSADNCGPDRLICSWGQVCNAGECTDKCQPPFGTCSDNYGNPECAILASSDKHCGSCQTTCSAPNVPHSKETACKDGACRAIACEDGYHLHNGACYENDPENCGAHGVSCSAIVPGWKSGACNKSVCIPDACKDFYYLDTTSGAAQCISNSNTCCGADCALCAGASICSRGKCETDCNAGETTCFNSLGVPYCANLQTSAENCGSCGNKCSIADNAQKVYCAAGNCAFDCKNDYHKYIAICEPDDSNNCGSRGNACPTSANGTAECKNKTCSLSCDSGYHEYNGICEPDDSNNCGSRGNACPTTANGTAECKNKTCSMSCNSGYHEYNGICEANNNANCGYHAKECTASLFDNALEAACSKEGICQITECNVRYEISPGKLSCFKACGSAYSLCDDKITCCKSLHYCDHIYKNKYCEAAIVPWA